MYVLSVSYVVGKLTKIVAVLFEHLNLAFGGSEKGQNDVEQYGLAFVVDQFVRLILLDAVLKQLHDFYCEVTCAIISIEELVRTLGHHQHCLYHVWQ